MTFIITLVSLIIERFLHWSHLRQWQWFQIYQRNIGHYLRRLPAWLTLCLSVLPLLIGVGVIDWLLDCWLYGILKILFGIAILVYCMGPENLWVQTIKCIHDIQNQDPQLAINSALSSFQIAHPTDSQVFHRALTSAIFVVANQRIFAVIFWFVLLGPMGAVLYRAIALSSKSSESEISVVAQKAHKILDWLPARLFTLIFALGGNFVEVIKIWKKDVGTNINMNDRLIAECGLAAIDHDTQQNIAEDSGAEKNALELLDRVFIMSLLILAMIVIIIK